MLIVNWAILRSDHMSLYSGLDAGYQVILVNSSYLLVLQVSRVNSEDHTPSPTQLQKSKRSEKRRLKSTDEQEDSDNGGENGENG